MVAAALVLPLVRVSGLSLAYGDGNVVEDVSFDVARGETVALVGPSGVGKSTILAALAGLSKPRAGSIVTERGVLDGPTPKHAMVFQDGALFPWLTLRQNVLYALARRGISRAARGARADDLLARARLAGHGEKFPHELSGGMKKRGAFARALASEPDLLLLDEAFSALDVTTRAELHRELAALFTERGVGVVLVTHDLAETALVSDRALVVRARGARGASITAEVVIDAPRPRHEDDRGVVRAIREIESALGHESLRKEDGDVELEARVDDRPTGREHSFHLGRRLVAAR